MKNFCDGGYFRDWDFEGNMSMNVTLKPTWVTCIVGVYGPMSAMHYNRASMHGWRTRYAYDIHQTTHMTGHGSLKGDMAPEFA